MAEPRRSITSSAQLRALASPARQEILDILARTGPASAAELGRLLQRPADGLYYHLRALERAGLVRAGSRTRAGRSETVYRSAYREPALRHDVSPGGNSTAVTAIVASMFRLGVRDFRKAAASGAVRTEGPRRDLWALRVAGRLFEGDLEVVNRRIRGLRDAVTRRRTGGKLYALTILITPLDHRARKRQRAARPPKRRPS